MGANDSADLVASNPYRDNNIGVEKLLEINSEENHNDVCLSYIFTYRDFADGVLGLAWVAEAGTVAILFPESSLPLSSSRNGQQGSLG